MQTDSDRPVSEKQRINPVTINGLIPFHGQPILWSITRVRPAKLLLVGLACCLLPGCGAEAYKRRLKETVEYFAYLEKLDRNLSREWQGGGGAIRLRPPAQFELIPPPKPQVDEEGEPIPIPPQKDPRQPRYLGAVLPGLEGAWQTTLEVAVGDNSKQVPAYMYVLSNRQMLQDPEQAKEASEFHTDVVARVTEALRLPFPEEDEWEEKRHPSSEGYVEQKLFNLITLEPGRQLGGAPTEILIYQNKVQDIWAVVMFVIPQGVDSRQHLPERIALCLETLKVSAEKPGKVGPSKTSRPAF